MIVYVVTLVIVILDQWTKELVRLGFELHEARPVLDGFFNLVYVRNTGAAFGFLNGRNLVLIGISVAMIVFLIVARRSFLGHSLTHRFAYGLLIGGIIGNLIDRIRLGFVVDFLDFHIGSAHWPSFNVADSAICVGFAIYFLRTWMVKEPSGAPAAPAAAPSASPAPAADSTPAP